MKLLFVISLLMAVAVPASSQQQKNEASEEPSLDRFLGNSVTIIKQLKNKVKNLLNQQYQTPVCSCSSTTSTTVPITTNPTSPTTPVTSPTINPTRSNTPVTSPSISPTVRSTTQLPTTQATIISSTANTTSSSSTPSTSPATTPISTSSPTTLPSTKLPTTTTVSSTTTSTTSTTSPSTTATSTSTSLPTTSGPILNNCQVILKNNSGSFSSPNFPQNYPNNANCSWLIMASNRITITFKAFKMESPFDFITVYNGSTTSSSRLLVATGASIPSPISPISNQVLITFTSDSSATEPGFNATYSLESETPVTTPSTVITTSTMAYPDFSRPTNPDLTLGNCHSILPNDMGTFNSPYYPKNYPNNIKCPWLITASGPITITFHQFRTQSPYDTVKIYDGPRISDKLLFTATGTSIPPPISTNSSDVLIWFNSDSSVTDTGFNASYSVPLIDSYCTNTTVYSQNNDSSSLLFMLDGNILCSCILQSILHCGENITDASSGFISSPNFPYGYPANSRCIWMVRTAPGTRIQFHFTDFSTGLGDIVQVFHSESCTTYPIIRQSGNVSPVCGFVSNGNWLKINFTSGESTANFYPGFRVSFTTDHGCGGTLNSSNQGTIMSPGYNINGTFTYSCDWKLGVNQGPKLNFSMSEVRGNAPYIRFNEGYQPSYQWAYGQPTLSFFVISSSNQVSLSMISSYSPVYCLLSCSESCINSVCNLYESIDSRWKASYSATTGPTNGCYGSMNTDTKTVTSPGYPFAYTQRGLTCNWKIVEPADKRIQLVFPVTINMFQSDSLQIINPPRTLTIRGGTVDLKPIEIESFETSLTFFASAGWIDQLVYTGWSINWNAF